MKFKLLLMVFAFCLASTSMSAAFPVKRVVKTTTNTTVSADVNEEETLVAVGAKAGKSQITALLLWFFLGGFAAHRWYLGSPIGWNILYIVTLGGLFIWALVDLIDIISENYPKYHL